MLSFFVQSSELGLPHRLTRRRVWPTPLGSGGKVHSLAREGVGGVPIPTRGHTQCIAERQMVSVLNKKNPPLTLYSTCKILFCLDRYYSEQQHNTRLKARRARVGEARKQEERERLEYFGILSHPPSPISFSKYLAPSGIK